MFIRKIFFKIKRKIFYFRHKFYPEQLMQLVDSTLFNEGRIVPLESPEIDIDFGGTVNGV